MAAEYRREVKYIQEMVTVGDGVHAVFRETREAHVGARKFAVKRQSGTGERPAAERRFVYRLVGCGKPLRVAHKSLRVRHPELSH